MGILSVAIDLVAVILLFLLNSKSNPYDSLHYISSLAGVFSEPSKFIFSKLKKWGFHFHLILSGALSLTKKLGYFLSNSLMEGV